MKFNLIRLFMVITFICLLINGNFYAQNMSHTVKRQNVKFAKGTNKTVIPGKADYGMSYVYIVNAKKDQMMEIKSDSKNNIVRFSLFAPEKITDNQLAFDTTTWKGNLPESGNYTIVLVMNEENLKKIPYSLSIQIK